MADTPEKKGKAGLKMVLAAVVALVVIGSVVQLFTHKAKNAISTNGGSRSANNFSPRATATPQVTLNGHGIPDSGGPVVVLNPGLAAAGGKVGVYGGGFDPGHMVEVALVAGHTGRGTVVASGKTGRYGNLNAQFTMPLLSNSAKETVVAREANSTKMATAQLMSPGGVGTMSIDGKPMGRPGNSITISAAGFVPGETINAYWGRISGTPAATMTADKSGGIHHMQIRVGVAPVGPTTMVLVGQRSHTAATAPFTMLGLYPSAMIKPYTARDGKPMTVSGSGFAPNEPILIYLNSSGGPPALTAPADNTGHVHTGFILPYGMKGAQSLTLIGSQSRASVSSTFSITPYSPMVEANTYGGMPGTELSFYASGFAANEVVLVYTGGQGGGKLVTAFRVNAQGSAAAAGKYVIPSGTGPAVSFKMVGQRSGGVASTKVSVTAPSGPAISIPPQPPYTLPPSLGGKPTAKPSTPGSKPSGPSAPPSSNP